MLHLQGIGVGRLDKEGAVENGLTVGVQINLATCSIR